MSLQNFGAWWFLHLHTLILLNAELLNLLTFWSPHSAAVNIKVVSRGMSWKGPHNYWRHHPATPLLLFLFRTSSFGGLRFYRLQFCQTLNSQINLICPWSNPMLNTPPYPPASTMYIIFRISKLHASTPLAFITHNFPQSHEVRMTWRLTFMYFSPDLRVLKDSPSLEQILRPNTLVVMVSFFVAIY
jgi:hypothetical protein